MAIRLLHISDLHLDCGFKTKEKNLSNLLKEAQRTAFTSAVDYALHERCHIVALAGDVFQDDQMSFRTEDFLYTGLNKLLEAGVVVVYVSGNHDFIGLQRSLLRLSSHPDFIYFDKPEPSKVIREINGHRVALVGCGHDANGIRQNMAKAFPVGIEGELSIGFYHGMVQGSLVQEDEEEPYMTCTLQDLICKNYQYWALGHIHKRQILAEGIAYSGSIQAVRRSENQKKGGWLVTIDPTQTELAFLPFSTVEFRDLLLTIDIEAGAPSLYAQLRRCLTAALEEEGRFIFNVTLIGMTSEYDTINHDTFCSDFLYDFQNQRILDLKLDLSRLMPLNYDKLEKSPYLSIALKALENPTLAAPLVSRFKSLEDQGIDVYGIVEKHKDALKNQLLYLFKEEN